MQVLDVVEVHEFSKKNETKQEYNFILIYVDLFSSIFFYNLLDNLLNNIKWNPLFRINRVFT